MPPPVQGPVHDYDVVGHPQADFHFSVVFPFHPGGPFRGSVTLLREYAQVGPCHGLRVEWGVGPVP